jgi:sirohydrochlorin ferrochelatase
MCPTFAKEFTMPKDKLVAIKDAAHAAGVDEETLRQELEKGLLKGEKKNNWFWDEWYVSSSEMDQLKERKKNRFRRTHRVNSAAASQRVDSEKGGAGSTSGGSAGAESAVDNAMEDSDLSAVERLEQSSSIAVTALATLLEPELTQSSAEQEKETGNWRLEYREVIKRVAEEIMRPLLERLELQAEALREKDMLIRDQTQQLRLLPDYAKRDEEQRLALEAKELEAQALEADIAQQREAAARDLDNLEITWRERLDEEEAAKQATEEQLESLRQEREVESRELHMRLSEMQQEIEELRKPWWKKVFK